MLKSFNNLKVFKTIVISFYTIPHISGFAPVQYTQSCSLYPWTSLNSPVKSKVCLRISRRFQHHHRLGWMLTCSSLGLKLILSNERLPDNTEYDYDRANVWEHGFSILGVIYVIEDFTAPAQSVNPLHPFHEASPWSGMESGPERPDFHGWM